MQRLFSFAAAYAHRIMRHQFRHQQQLDTVLSVKRPLSYNIAWDDDSGAELDPEISNVLLDQEGDSVIWVLPVLTDRQGSNRLTLETETLNTASLLVSFVQAGENFVTTNGSEALTRVTAEATIPADGEVIVIVSDYIFFVRTATACTWNACRRLQEGETLMLRLTKPVLCILTGLLLLGLLAPLSVMAQESTPTTHFKATLAIDWMKLLYQLVRDENVNAPAASRIYAYAGVALYEGVVPGMPDNFSIGGQRPGLAMLPFPEEGLEYDWPAAANASLARVIHDLFASSGSQDTLDRIEAMRQQQQDTRLQAVAADVVERSAALGDAIGAAISDWAASDNYGPTREMEYHEATGEPALWVETTPGQHALEPFWGQLRPFGLGYPEQCNVALHLDFSSDPNSTFYKQALEVLNAGDRLTDEQRAIARFWLDTPGITGTPAGHWVMIETQFAEQYDLLLSRAAEMYALTNSALADAFISAWNLKYQIDLVRPVTYIQQYIRRNWAPYIQTPPFPEYPSGHSVASAAAAEVLTTMFGQVAFTDRTPIFNGHESLERSFTSFEAAASEAAISRMYGGIHYRAAIENGLSQGRCVGQAVLNSIRLRSIPQGEG